MERIHRRIVQKDLKDPDSYNGVTHLDPDILECEFKWAFRSITMSIDSGGDEISAELSQILKDDAVTVLHSLLENSAMATRLEKFSFHFNPKEGQCQRMFKLLQKVMLKILQVRLQQYMNWELPGVQTGFRKGRGTRDQISNIWWIIEKVKNSRKHIKFCFIDYAKTFDCVDHSKLWKILKEMGILDQLTYLLRNL